VAAVIALLRRPDVCLLTLVGPPGIGKTRLSIQVAADLLPDPAVRAGPALPDGVCFVPLAPISDPNLVVSAITQALELRGATSGSLLERLKSYLQRKHLLLLLDNFEQVIPAAPLLADLLTACPGVKALVTSRELLHLYGEHPYPVPPLALPAPARLPDLAALAQYEAIAFFRHRAQAVSPAFELTERNAPVVAAICGRLDGLPLAIELAAARLLVLPPEELLARLTSSLRLLTGGAGNLPARQRTLRAAIEWSHALLTPAEQTLFRRLGVFVGGCTLKAIEAVCGSSEPEAPGLDILDGVTSLVGKSLLQRQEGVAGEPRLTMLETIREYAGEQLAASAEAGAIGRQHARYFVELVERVEPELRGPEQVLWFDRLEQEQDNIRAVFAWCREEASGAEGVQIGLRLVGAMSWYWYTRGPFSEGRARAAEVLARPQAKEHTTLRTRALRPAANLAWVQGDFAAVRTLAEEGLALARKSGDRQMEAVFLHNLGHLALEEAEGDLAAARSLYEQSLAIQRELGNRPNVAVALNSLALVDRAEGDLAAARPRIEEALAIVRELGDTAGIAYSLQRLGELALREGNYPMSRSLLEQALTMRRESGEQQKLLETLDGLGYAALREGDYVTAAACFRESLTAGTGLGTRRYTWVSVAGLAVLAGAPRTGADAGEPGLRQAAKLFGAYDGLRETDGVKIDPVLKVEWDRDIAAIRAQLDEATWQDAWEEGRAMSLEQAIAEALLWLDQVLRPDTSEVARSGAAKAGERGPTYPDDLTVREVEVLRLLAAGRSNQAIAAELVLSLRTVERHISNIYGKLGATGKVARATATAYAHRHGLAN
jgi:predicted ATPase/DNA-binding CsgD family transcriptional regulator